MIFLNAPAFFILLLVFWIFRDLFTTQDKQERLFFISLVLAIIALSRPAINNEITQERFHASEYIVALDASYSMMAEDIKPNRYDVAKESIVSLLKKNTQDRFSIFTFTTNPLLISPPTTDHQIAINALDVFSPQYVLTKGTSLLSLLEQIAKLEIEHKSLLLFSDGGEEHNIEELLNIAKKYNIQINTIAIGSKKGVVLQKNNKALKDNDAHLIISRINPILKDLSYGSGGFYIEINSENKDISTQIIDHLQVKKDKDLNIDIVSYKELYHFPLFLAFLILLLSLTKIQKIVPFLTLIYFLYPHNNAEASLLDFHYKKLAKEAYKQKDYTQAIYYFKKLSPSKYATISIANAYYKKTQYKESLRYYAKVQSKSPHIKSILFYNMANAAFELKKYKRAQDYYKKSLALEYSKEAKENLFLIYKYKLHEKIDVADMLPKVNDKEVKSISKNSETKKDEKNEGSSSSQQKATQGSQGGASAKKTKQNNKKNIPIQGKQNKYKMGYNAYELINKGYINEKQPW